MRRFGGVMMRGRCRRGGRAVHGHRREHHREQGKEVEQAAHALT
jgi:hypothetical protein